MRVRPDPNAQAVGTLEAGDVRFVARQRRQKSGTWSQIRLEKGHSGWAPPALRFVRLPSRHVTGPPLDLRKEPREDSDVLRTLREGAVVQVFDYDDSGRGTWVHLVPPSGNGGWVPGRTPLTVYGGSLGQAISGVFIASIGGGLEIALAHGGLMSNLPHAILGIGLGLIARSWRVSAESTARKAAR